MTDEFMFELPYEKAKPGSRNIFNKRLIVLASADFSAYRPLTEVKDGLRYIKIFYSIDEVETCMEKLRKQLAKKYQRKVQTDRIIWEEADWKSY